MSTEDQKIPAIKAPNVSNVVYGEGENPRLAPVLAVVIVVIGASAAFIWWMGELGQRARASGKAEVMREETYTREALRAMALRLQDGTTGSEPLVEINATALLFALDQVPADLSHEEAYRRILGRLLKDAVDKLPGGMTGSTTERQ